MLDDIVGNYGGRLLLAAGGVGLALLVLIGILWLMRNRAPSPFVRGGKNRQPRLQVLDAAAVDARRRLVLVRRDGVEHLIMIGGPTDIVIESGIGDHIRPVAQSQSLPLEAAAIPENRPAPRLDTVRESPRAIARQPEPEKQRPTPPARAAIEPPAIPLPERAEPSRPAATIAPVAALSPAPSTVAAVVPAAAAAAPIVTAPVTERLQPVAITPAPAPPVETAPAMVPERRDVAEAVDILEAARQRVLPPQVDNPQKISETEPSPVAPPQTPILAKDAYLEASFNDGDIELPAPLPETPQKQLGSDFESILEAEMTNNLKAERVASPTPATVAPERRDADMPAPPAGDAALQDEMERIFGEISVKR